MIRGLRGKSSARIHPDAAPAVVAAGAVAHPLSSNADATVLAARRTTERKRPMPKSVASSEVVSEERLEAHAAMS